MDQVKKQYENEPVLFIAVNSGNARRAMETYAKACNLTYPIYIDLDRSFEKKTLAREISLSNIHEWLILGPDGMPVGNGESDIRRNLKLASWKIDPKDMPEGIKPAWRAVEFGQYTQAAEALAKALTSPDPNVKEWAAKISSAINAEIARLMAEAKTCVEAGKLWDAYKRYDYIATVFKDAPASRPAASETTRLKSNSMVAREAAARALLDTCRMWLASEKSGERKQGRDGIQTLQTSLANTEAGAIAKEIVLPK